MNFTGILTPRDFQVALYLHHRPPKVMGMAQFLVGIGYVGAIAYGMKSLSPLILAVLTFPFFLLVMWRLVLFEQQVSDVFEGDPSLSYPYHFELTGEIIQISSRVHDFRIEWSGLSHYKQNRYLTLLYRSESEFFLFPNHWFESSDDLAWFHRQVRMVLGSPCW